MTYKVGLSPMKNYVNFRHFIAVYPHMRGVHGNVLQNLVEMLRFTPTHVGFTPTTTGSASSTTVHPHACGVYLLRGLLSLADTGSSPHTWSLPARLPQQGDGERFIPTYVGFTEMVAKVVSTMSGLSPRMWGLHYTLTMRQMFNYTHGSSPRTWGFRSTSRRAARNTSVHPHVRGVYQ